MRIQGVAKTFPRRNAKTSKHRVLLTPLWFNHFKPNQQRFQELNVSIAFRSLPSRFLCAMTVLIIRMIFTHQRRSTMKSTTCPSFNWRLLARAARPCFSSAGHFFGLRISPSCSEISSRRRISSRSADTGKFLGRDGKIEGLFITNPNKFYCLYFKQFTFYHLLTSIL